MSVTLRALSEQTKRLSDLSDTVSSDMAELDAQIRNAMDDTVGVCAKESLRQIKAEFDRNSKSGIEVLSSAASQMLAAQCRIKFEADGATALFSEAMDIKESLGTYE